MIIQKEKKPIYNSLLIFLLYMFLKYISCIYKKCGKMYIIQMRNAIPSKPTKM